MIENPLDHRTLGNAGDDPHLRAARRTPEWIDLEDLSEELGPGLRVRSAYRLRGVDLLGHRSGAPLEGGQVGKAEGDVLDENVQVVRSLPVRERSVDLARLGIDKVRGEGVPSRRKRVLASEQSPQ